MPDLLPELIAAATDADGQPPFSDQSLVDFAGGSRRLITVEDSAGAALVTTSTGAVEAELVVHPDARRRGLGERLLLDVLDSADGPVLIWAHGDHPAARMLAVKHGLKSVRELLQMRAGVPDTGQAAHIPQPERTPHAELADGATRELARELPSTSSASGTQTGSGAIRPFRPGTDDAAWLELNAQAFAEHPEQGKITRHDLDARVAERWFDTGDFLLLWDGDDLIGFCWLKVDGTLGEFYAVGVSPQRQGEGIGRTLVEAGMRRLAERGIRESSLYVEADNEPAVRLYRAFGFVTHTIDIQYRRESAR